MKNIIELNKMTIEELINYYFPVAHENIPGMEIIHTRGTEYPVHALRYVSFFYGVHD